jgi:lipopolysaccharide export system permease protein
MAAAGRKAESPLPDGARSPARRRLWPVTGFTALDRYIARLLLVPVATIVAALGLLMLLERALVLLSEMTAAGMASQFFLPLMARLVPYYLMQAIPASFAVSLVLAIDRLTAEHELEVMAAAGLSPARIILPMTLVGLVLAGLTLAVSGWLEPVGRYGYRSLHAFAISDSQLRKLQTREIYAPGDDAMLTVDAASPDGLKGLFLWLSDGSGRETVATAPAGTVTTRRNPAALDFSMTDGLLLGADDTELRFAELSGSHVLAATALPRARGRDARELTLSELVAQNPDGLAATPRQQRAAEIYNRIARSFSILVLPWLVLPLLFAGAGRRRSNWPAVALIIAMVVSFYHAVNFARNLVANGEAGVGAVTALTLVVPALAIAAVWRLSRLDGLLSRWRWPAGWWPAARRAPPAIGRRGGLALYLARRLVVMIATMLIALVLLLQIVDLFESGGALVRGRAGLAGFAYYAWCRLPATLLQAMPIATLAGALLVWASMRASSELVAIQAAGVSYFGLLRRALAVPVLIGLAMIAIAEFWSPVSQVAFAQWWERLDPDEAEVSPDKPRWFRLGDDIVSATMASAAGDRLTSLRLFRRDGDGRLTERITADSASWADGAWRLAGASAWKVTETGASPRPLADFTWQTPLSPPDVRQFFAAPVPLSGRDAWAAGNSQGPVDRAEGLYRTRVLMTFSIAAAPLVMLLLSVALIVVPTRDKRLAWALFQCLVGGLSFLVVNGYCEVMGLAGEISPWLAVVAAPLAFAWIGLDRLLRADGAS